MTPYSFPPGNKRPAQPSTQTKAVEPWRPRGTADEKTRVLWREGWGVVALATAVPGCHLSGPGGPSPLRGESCLCGHVGIACMLASVNVRPCRKDSELCSQEGGTSWKCRCDVALSHMVRSEPGVTDQDDASREHVRQR
jgi:hypothetical protein